VEGNATLCGWRITRAGSGVLHYWRNNNVAHLLASSNFMPPFGVLLLRPSDSGPSGSSIVVMGLPAFGWSPAGQESHLQVGEGIYFCLAGSCDCTPL
jgi:hypothetical protein